MITPSNFRADPLGWAGNQAGHILIAAVFAYWVAVGGYLLMGEYPARWAIFGALVAMYLAIEVADLAAAGYVMPQDTLEG